ncbi:MAG: hypothetical protein Q9210_002978 [Variospora velana]
MYHNLDAPDRSSSIINSSLPSAISRRCFRTAARTPKHVLFFGLRAPSHKIAWSKVIDCRSSNISPYLHPYSSSSGDSDV